MACRMRFNNFSSMNEGMNEWMNEQSQIGPYTRNYGKVLVKKITIKKLIVLIQTRINIRTYVHSVVMTVFFLLQIITSN